MQYFRKAELDLLLKKPDTSRNDIGLTVCIGKKSADLMSLTDGCSLVETTIEPKKGSLGDIKTSTTAAYVAYSKNKEIAAYYYIDKPREICQQLTLPSVQVSFDNALKIAENGDIKLQEEHLKLLSLFLVNPPHTASKSCVLRKVTKYPNVKYLKNLKFNEDTAYLRHEGSIYFIEKQDDNLTAKKIEFKSKIEIFNQITTSEQLTTRLKTLHEDTPVASFDSTFKLVEKPLKLSSAQLNQLHAFVISPRPSKNKSWMLLKVKKDPSQQHGLDGIKLEPKTDYYFRHDKSLYFIDTSDISHAVERVEFIKVPVTTCRILSEAGLDIMHAFTGYNHARALPDTHVDKNTLTLAKETHTLFSRLYRNIRSRENEYVGSKKNKNERKKYNTKLIDELTKKYPKVAKLNEEERKLLLGPLLRETEKVEKNAKNVTISNLANIDLTPYESEFSQLIESLNTQNDQDLSLTNLLKTGRISSITLKVAIDKSLTEEELEVWAGVTLLFLYLRAKQENNYIRNLVENTCSLLNTNENTDNASATNSSIPVLYLEKGILQLFQSVYCFAEASNLELPSISEPRKPWGPNSLVINVMKPTGLSPYHTFQINTTACHSTHMSIKDHQELKKMFTNPLFSAIKINFENSTLNAVREQMNMYQSMITASSPSTSDFERQITPEDEDFFWITVRKKGLARLNEISLEIQEQLEHCTEVAIDTIATKPIDNTLADAIKQIINNIDCSALAVKTPDDVIEDLDIKIENELKSVLQKEALCKELKESLKDFQNDFLGQENQTYTTEHTISHMRIVLELANRISGKLTPTDLKLATGTNFAHSMTEAMFNKRRAGLEKRRAQLRETSTETQQQLDIDIVTAAVISCPIDSALSDEIKLIVGNMDCSALATKVPDDIIRDVATKIESERQIVLQKKALYNKLKAPLKNFQNNFLEQGNQEYTIEQTTSQMRIVLEFVNSISDKLSQANSKPATAEDFVGSMKKAILNKRRAGLGKRLQEAINDIDAEQKIDITLPFKKYEQNSTQNQFQSLLNNVTIPQIDLIEQQPATNKPLENAQIPNKVGNNNSIPNSDHSVPKSLADSVDKPADEPNLFSGASSLQAIDDIKTRLQEKLDEKNKADPSKEAELAKELAKINQQADKQRTRVIIAQGILTELTNDVFDQKEQEKAVVDKITPGLVDEISILKKSMQEKISTAFHNLSSPTDLDAAESSLVETLRKAADELKTKRSTALEIHKSFISGSQLDTHTSKLITDAETELNVLIKETRQQHVLELMNASVREIFDTDYALVKENIQKTSSDFSVQIENLALHDTDISKLERLQTHIPQKRKELTDTLNSIITTWKNTTVATTQDPAMIQQNHQELEGLYAEAIKNFDDQCTSIIWITQNAQILADLENKINQLINSSPQEVLSPENEQDQIKRVKELTSIATQRVNEISTSFPGKIKEIQERITKLDIQAITSLDEKYTGLAAQNKATDELLQKLKALEQQAEELFHESDEKTLHEKAMTIRQEMTAAETTFKSKMTALGVESQHLNDALIDIKAKQVNIENTINEAAILLATHHETKKLDELTKQVKATLNSLASDFPQASPKTIEELDQQKTLSLNELEKTMSNWATESAALNATIPAVIEKIKTASEELDKLSVETKKVLELSYGLAKNALNCDQIDKLIAQFDGITTLDEFTEKERALSDKMKQITTPYLGKTLPLAIHHLQNKVNSHCEKQRKSIEKLSLIEQALSQATQSAKIALEKIEPTIAQQSSVNITELDKKKADFIKQIQVIMDQWAKSKPVVPILEMDAVSLSIRTLVASAQKEVEALHVKIQGSLEQTYEEQKKTLEEKATNLLTELNDLKLDATKVEEDTDIMTFKNMVLELQKQMEGLEKSLGQLLPEGVWQTTLAEKKMTIDKYINSIVKHNLKILSAFIQKQAAGFGSLQDTQALEKEQQSLADEAKAQVADWKACLEGFPKEADLLTHVTKYEHDASEIIINAYKSAQIQFAMAPVNATLNDIVTQCHQQFLLSNDIVQLNEQKEGFLKGISEAVEAWKADLVQLPEILQAASKAIDERVVEITQTLEQLHQEQQQRIKALDPADPADKNTITQEQLTQHVTEVLQFGTERLEQITLQIDQGLVSLTNLDELDKKREELLEQIQTILSIEPEGLINDLTKGNLDTFFKAGWESIETGSKTCIEQLERVYNLKKTTLIDALFEKGLKTLDETFEEIKNQTSKKDFCGLIHKLQLEINALEKELQQRAVPIEKWQVALDKKKETFTTSVKKRVESNSKPLIEDINSAFSSLEKITMLEEKKQALKTQIDATVNSWDKAVKEFSKEFSLEQAVLETVQKYQDQAVTSMTRAYVTSQARIIMTSTNEMLKDIENRFTAQLPVLNDINQLNQQNESFQQEIKTAADNFVNEIEPVQKNELAVAASENRAVLEQAVSTITESVLKLTRALEQLYQKQGDIILNELALEQVTRQMILSANSGLEEIASRFDELPQLTNLQQLDEKKAELSKIIQEIVDSCPRKLMDDLKAKHTNVWQPVVIHSAKIIEQLEQAYNLQKEVLTNQLLEQELLKLEQTSIAPNKQETIEVYCNRMFEFKSSVTTLEASLQQLEKPKAEWSTRLTQTKNTFTTKMTGVVKENLKPSIAYINNAFASLTTIASLAATQQEVSQQFNKSVNNWGKNLEKFAKEFDPIKAFAEYKDQAPKTITQAYEDSRTRILNAAKEKLEKLLPLSPPAATIEVLERNKREFYENIEAIMQAVRPDKTLDAIYEDIMKQFSTEYEGQNNLLVTQESVLTELSALEGITIGVEKNDSINTFCTRMLGIQTKITALTQKLQTLPADQWQKTLGQKQTQLDETMQAVIQDNTKQQGQGILEKFIPLVQQTPSETTLKPSLEEEIQKTSTPWKNVLTPFPNNGRFLLIVTDFEQAILDDLQALTTIDDKIKDYFNVKEDGTKEMLAMIDQPNITRFEDTMKVALRADSTSFSITKKTLEEKQKLFNTTLDAVKTIQTQFDEALKNIDELSMLAARDTKKNVDTQSIESEKSTTFTKINEQGNKISDTLKQCGQTHPMLIPLTKKLRTVISEKTAATRGTVRKNSVDRTAEVTAKTHVEQAIETAKNELATLEDLTIKSISRTSNRDEIVRHITAEIDAIYTRLSTTNQQLRQNYPTAKAIIDDAQLSLEKKDQTIATMQAKILARQADLVLQAGHTALDSLRQDLPQTFQVRNTQVPHIEIEKLLYAEIDRIVNESTPALDVIDTNERSLLLTTQAEGIKKEIRDIVLLIEEDKVLYKEANDLLTKNIDEMDQKINTYFTLSTRIEESQVTLLLNKVNFLTNSCKRSIPRFKSFWSDVFKKEYTDRVENAGRDLLAAINDAKYDKMREDLKTINVTFDGVPENDQAQFETKAQSILEMLHQLGQIAQKTELFPTDIKELIEQKTKAIESKITEKNISVDRSFASSSMLYQTPISRKKQDPGSQQSSYATPNIAAFADAWTTPEQHPNRNVNNNYGVPHKTRPRSLDIPNGNLSREAQTNYNAPSSSNHPKNLHGNYTGKTSDNKAMLSPTQINDNAKAFFTREVNRFTQLSTKIQNVQRLSAQMNTSRNSITNAYETYQQQLPWNLNLDREQLYKNYKDALTNIDSIAEAQTGKIKKGLSDQSELITQKLEHFQNIQKIVSTNQESSLSTLETKQRYQQNAEMAYYQLIKNLPPELTYRKYEIDRAYHETLSVINKQWQQRASLKVQQEERKDVAMHNIAVLEERAYTRFPAIHDHKTLHKETQTILLTLEKVIKEAAPVNESLNASYLTTLQDSTALLKDKILSLSREHDLRIRGQENAKNKLAALEKQARALFRKSNNLDQLEKETQNIISSLNQVAYGIHAKGLQAPYVTNVLTLSNQHKQRIKDQQAKKEEAALSIKKRDRWISTGAYSLASAGAGYGLTWLAAAVIPIGLPALLVAAIPALFGLIGGIFGYRSRSNFDSKTKSARKSAASHKQNSTKEGSYSAVHQRMPTVTVKTGLATNKPPLPKKPVAKKKPEGKVTSGSVTKGGMNFLNPRRNAVRLKNGDNRKNQSDNPLTNMPQIRPRHH